MVEDFEEFSGYKTQTKNRNGKKILENFWKFLDSPRKLKKNIPTSLGNFLKLKKHRIFQKITIKLYFLTLIKVFSNVRFGKS